MNQRGIIVCIVLLHLKTETSDYECINNRLLVHKPDSEDQIRVDSESFEHYEAKMNEHIARINDMGKSQLASYVAHRRSILDLLDLSLKKSRVDKKYRLEEVLHNMIPDAANIEGHIF